MERFIRSKYEYKELSSSGRRAAIHNTGGASISSADEQPPPLPPKPGKKFGFALRSTSATFSRSRIDKFDKFTPPLSPALSGSDGRESPPRMNKQSRVFGSAVGNSHDDQFKIKMAALREMGFNDARRNSIVLKEMDGSLAGAVEALVRLGDGGKNAQSRVLTPVSAASSATGLAVEKRRASEVAPQAPPKDHADPFAALDKEMPPPQRAATQPLPQSSQLQPQASYNPFMQMTTQNQAPQTLQDSFAGLQMSYPSQPQPYNAEPAPNPAASTQYNPFLNNMPQQQQMQTPTYQQPAQTPYQQQLLQQQQQQQQNMHTQPLQAQHTSNPFLRASKSQTFPPPQSNPFMQQAPLQNPWLVSQPQVQSPLPQSPGHQTQAQSGFFSSQPVQQEQAQYQQNMYGQQQSNYVLATGTNPFYAQAPQQQQQQPQQPYQTQNPYQPYQNQQAFQQQMPQQNRYDKASILQLYSYPQMTPAPQPLQSLPEGSTLQPVAAPPSALSSPGRSVTMPITGTMNPYLASSPAPAPVQQQQQQQQQHPQMQAGLPLAPAATIAAPAPSVYTHSSRDSMAFVGLGSGRQSPDAFAGLSARYGR